MNFRFWELQAGFLVMEKKKYYYLDESLGNHVSFNRETNIS